MNISLRQDGILAGETAWREIDLPAVASNYRAIRAVVGPTTRILPCLKQDAYGCGAGQVAATLAAEGVDAFGVVSIRDAFAVRKAVPAAQILMYAGISPEAVDLVRDLDLTITVSGEEDLRRWLLTRVRLRVFVKVDLGFWRAGVAPVGLERLLDLCAAEPLITLVGLYAHLSEFGKAGSSAAEQVARLTPILERLKAAGRLPATIMVSSSDTMMRHPEFDFDAVDPGALLFGVVRPQPGGRDLVTRPALSAIKARIIALKQCDDSLGPTPRLPGYRPSMRLAVLGIGWGHGVPRRLAPGSAAIVGGRRVPIVPPTHLEHLRIDVTDVPDIKLGDEAILLGHSGTSRITLREIAAAWNTDEVGVSCGLRDNLVRLYAAQPPRFNQKKGE
ncbi:alanine racemase [Agrobacterium fabrum]|uniref:alanine racemase n=1 Tax=Agrobacterium fabrum TaxID=1176649 RepID=UPI00273DE360|nr:alanine racemase [Agrobacterium fabrum]WLP57464.1 alanine racemase [Agrobacterium fabrum]